MQVPFTTEEFLNVFKLYNEAVFPLQIILNLAAVFVLFLVIKKVKQSGRIISLLLAALWIWTGVVYHLMFFTALNKAAYIFGPLFILQGLMIFFLGTVYNLFSFSIRSSVNGFTGLLFTEYSLVIYPLIGYLTGHIYPYSPTFGAPCPITIFTMGILLFTENKLPLALLIIPFIWSLVGLSAVLNFSVYEDIGLLIAGFTVMGFYLLQKRRMKLQVKTA